MDGRLGFHGLDGFQQDTSDLNGHIGIGSLVVFKGKKLIESVFHFGFSRFGLKLCYGTILVFIGYCFPGYWMFSLSINFWYKSILLGYAAQLQFCASFEYENYLKGKLAFEKAPEKQIVFLLPKKFQRYKNEFTDKSVGFTGKIRK